MKTALKLGTLVTFLALISNSSCKRTNNLLSLSFGKESIENVTPNNPFSKAAVEDNIVLAKEALKSGAFLHETDEEGFKPIHHAALHAGTEILDLYYKNGADINAIDSDGITLLHLATASGNKTSIKWLVEHKLDINSKEFIAGYTPLHTVLGMTRSLEENDLLENVEEIYSLVFLLVSLKADVNACDSLGQTPLDLLRIHPGLASIKKLLIDNGAVSTLEN